MEQEHGLGYFIGLTLVMLAEAIITIGGTVGFVLGCIGALTGTH